LAAALLGFACVAGLGAAGQATALQRRPDLTVSPGAGQLSTPPGRTVEEAVDVVNLSQDDFDVTVSLEDLNVDGLGRATSRPAGESANSAATWGFVEPPSFLLPGGHTQTVRVSLTPPKDAAPGGYSAAVRVVGRRSSGGMATALHSVLLEVGGPGIVHAARVAGVFVPSRTYGSTFPVSVALENRGTTHIFATGTVVVRDALSRITARVPIPRTVILRGHTRLVTVRAPSPLLPWRITAQANVSFSDGVAGGSAQASGFALAYWSLAGVGLVLLFVLWRVFRFVRKRVRRRASRRIAAAGPAEVAVAHGHPATGPERYAGIPGVEDELQEWWAEPGSAEGTLEAEPEETEEEEIAPSPARAGAAPSNGEARRPLVIVTEREPEERSAPAIDGPEVPAPVRLRLADLAPAAEDGEGEKVEAPEEPPASTVESETTAPPALVLAPPPEPAFPPVPEEAIEVADDEQDLDRPAEAGQKEPVSPPEPPAAEPEPAPVPVTASVEATPAAPPEPAVERELQPVGATTSPSGERVARLQSSTRRKLAAAPPRALSAQGAVRRADVAIGMLAAGPGRSGERVAVALDLLRTIKTEPAVLGAVEAAYTEALNGRDDRATAPLALALDLLGSPRAADALLRAYASAPTSIVGSLEIALRGHDRAELRRKRSLVAALPKGRRASLELE
jgi:hypothetical protein